MLTRLFRKRGSGQGNVTESNPFAAGGQFDFNRPLTGKEVTEVSQQEVSRWRKEADEKERTSKM